MFSCCSFYYFDELCTRTVFNGQKLDSGLLYGALSKEKVRALPGFHAFTGCDQTGKFRIYSKETCWKTFIDLPEAVIKQFHELGSSNKHPFEEVINGLVLVVLNLYCNTRPSDIHTLRSLRWHIFSKYQSDKIPPTKHALLNVFYRSYYMARI